MVQRLALGTVQFGLNYGVANQCGQTPVAEAAKILDLARHSGLNTLDTAHAYGTSESVLGSCGVSHWRIVSKLPPNADTLDGGDWVRQCVTGSLSRLSVDALSGLLLHQPSLLFGAQGQAIYDAMVALKSRGTINKFGISVYTPDELEMLISRFEFDLVQLPLNVLDRRMIHSGWLDRLARSGIEIHSRSCFLQGLLLMDAAERPRKFQRWAPLWQLWEHWLEQHTLTPLEACLSFALSQQQISRIIVGVDNTAQLTEILHAADTNTPPPPDDLFSDDPDLLNPSRWNVL